LYFPVLFKRGRLKVRAKCCVVMLYISPAPAFVLGISRSEGTCPKELIAVKLYRMFPGLAIALITAFAITTCGGGDPDKVGPIKLRPTLQKIVLKADHKSVAAGRSTIVHATGHFSDGTMVDITDGLQAGSSMPQTDVNWIASPDSVARFGHPSSSWLQANLPGPVVVTATDALSRIEGRLTINITSKVANTAPAALSGQLATSLGDDRATGTSPDTRLAR